ncbi:MAG TPA: NAD(+) synthase [Syntrophomonas sp.]|jgi:NAD+ synthase|nr:NAD(+) synthase [Syntrophomonas sp.]HRW11618.1 NAD(+) synthase [Syntrophomonas sp.]
MLTSLDKGLALQARPDWKKAEQEYWTISTAMTVQQTIPRPIQSFNKEESTMNTEAVSDYLVNWLREKVQAAGCRGLILGISGGIDSAVAAALAKQAFPDDCLGLLMPCESSAEDLQDGLLLVESLDMHYHIINLEEAYRALLKELAHAIDLPEDSGRLVRANVKPRLRMTSLYYMAQAHQYLVMGTSNKSEITVGYATKYGDNGVDLQVLGDLRKEQVYALARYLNIPEQLITKAPSAGLWGGQTDEGEMGFTYRELDEYIRTGAGATELVGKIQTMYERSAHKRSVPPIAVLPAGMGEA